MKAKYYLKRFGILGYIRYKLSRLKVIKFNTYLYLQHKYYEKLTEDEYESELGEWYENYCNRTVLNIKNPETFNDKIQWLKVNDNTELRQICSDKYRVRDYIKSLALHELHLIPLLGVWDSEKEIDFEKLPESFVLKQSAACKLNLIITNKNEINIDSIRKLLKEWLEVTYGFNGMELQYLKMPKKIIAEEYMQELDGNLLDYKIFCFNGKPTYIEVIGDRGKNLKGGHSAFFDTDWNLVDIHTLTYPSFEKSPAKPSNLDSMIKIAEILSTPFIFVRVDLYDINNKVYFGELTFTPTNGIARWCPDEANKLLGDLIHLPI